MAALERVEIIIQDGDISPSANGMSGRCPVFSGPPLSAGGDPASEFHCIMIS